MTRSPQELAQTVRERAAQWRAWATGERKQPPHQLLGFTTDVRALADEVERLAEAGERAREALRAECRCRTCGGDGRRRCICDKQVCTCYVSRDPHAPCHACKGSGIKPRTAEACAALGERP